MESAFQFDEGGRIVLGVQGQGGRRQLARQVGVLGEARHTDRIAELVVLGLADRGADPEDPVSRSLPEQVDAFEAQVLRDTLSEALGDARTAVAWFGIPRKTFYDKLRRHDIEIDAFRPRRNPQD